VQPFCIPLDLQAFADLKLRAADIRKSSGRFGRLGKEFGRGGET
jgi:hypothetical protein